MRLRSPGLEKAVRRLVRREIRSSPALRAEYRRYHNPCLERLQWGLAIVVGLPLSLAVLGMLLFVSAFGVMMILILVRDHTDLSLASLALLLMGMLFWARLSGYHRLFGGLKLRTAAYFPVSDHQLLVEALTRVALDGGLVGLVSLITFTYLVWSYDLTAWAYLPAVGAAVLQGVTSAVVCLLVVARLPKNDWIGPVLFVAGSLMIAGGVAGLICAGNGVEPAHPALLWPAFLLLPTGWVVGAFYWGVVQGHAAGWLLLVPAAVLIRAGVRWVQHGIETRELAVDSPDPVPAVFERGILSGPDSIEATSDKATRGSSKGRPNGRLPLPSRERVGVRGHEHDQWASRSSADADADSTEAIEQRILEGGAMGRGEWVRQGWIERLVCRALTEREQTVIEYLTGAPPAWTLQWGTFIIFLILAVGLAWLMQSDGNPAIIPALIVFAWALASSAGFLEKSPDDSLGTWWRSGQAFFPLGFMEASRAVVKVAVLRCLLWLPLTIGFGLVAGWLFGISPLRSAGLGLIPVLLYLGCMPLWISWLFQETVAFKCVHLIVPLFLCLSLFRLLPVEAALAGSLVLASFSAWAYCAWDHHRA